MRISDWSSDVCSSDLLAGRRSRSGALLPFLILHLPVASRCSDAGARCRAVLRARYFSAIGVRSWKLLEEWLGSEHGTASSPRASRRGLSSDGPRQRRPAGVPRRGGLPAFSRVSGRKQHALRLALLWPGSEERRVGKEC